MHSSSLYAISLILVKVLINSLYYSAKESLSLYKARSILAHILNTLKLLRS